MKSLVSVGVFLALLTRVHSDIVLTQPSAETVRPGESVRLTCKTSGFDLSSYYMSLVRQVPGQGLEWLLAYYNPSNKYFAPGIQDRFTPSKDSTNNMFSVEVSRLQPDDTAVYYCARSSGMSDGYHMDYWGGGTLLTVTAAEESAPTVYPLFSCEQSSAVETDTVGCLAKDYSPVGINLYWQKDEANITTGMNTYPAVLNKKGTYTRSSGLTVSETASGSSAIYCVVQYKNTVQKIPVLPRDLVVIHPTVVISVSSLEDIRRSRRGTAVCSINEFQPQQFTVHWLKEGQPVDSDVVTSPPFKVNGNFSATSQITFPATDWFEGVVYTCQVTHKNYMQSRNISYNQALHPQQPSVSVLLPPTSEESTENSVILTCLVRAFSPRRIFVTWTVEDTPVDSRMYKNTAVEAENGNNSFFMYSLLSVRSEQWLRGASFSCVVAHETLPMKTIARTVNRSSGKPSFVNISLALMDTVDNCQ